MNACFCHYINNLYVVSDDEEMMNAEDVEDEVADDEQPSGSTRRDQSGSLLGSHLLFVIDHWTMMQVVKRLKLYVLLKIYFNLLEANVKLVLFNAKSLAGE